MHPFATHVKLSVEVKADFAPEFLVTMLALKLVNVATCEMAQNLTT